MPTTVLVPHTTTERCYLSEALLWVALSRFPLSWYTENGQDVREDLDNIAGLDPSLPIEDPVTDSECARVGLPPNPEYEAFEAGDYHQVPEVIESFLKIDKLPDEKRKELEIDLPVSIAFYRNKAAWDTDYEAFVDIPKTKLFLALREGRLVASGKQLPRPTISDSLDLLDSTDWAGWTESPWKPIPADLWISHKIDWSQCWAEGRGAAFGLILVDTDQLLGCFPAPPAEPCGDVARIGTDLVLTEDAAVQKIRPTRGRPPFNWDAFHVEIARRVHETGLPNKQEAFISEMQSWCRANWNREVARSTLLQKIKPYYDAFIRKSKKSAG